MAHATEPAEQAPGALDFEELRRKYRAERDKRLRPEGRAQYLDVAGNLERFAADPYLEPGERDPRVADVDTLILGGGWSGLQMAVSLQGAGARDFLIVDQAGDFGSGGGPTSWPPRTSTPRATKASARRATTTTRASWTTRARRSWAGSTAAARSATSPSSKRGVTARLPATSA